MVVGVGVGVLVEWLVSTSSGGAHHAPPAHSSITHHRVIHPSSSSPSTHPPGGLIPLSLPTLPPNPIPSSIHRFFPLLSSTSFHRHNHHLHHHPPPLFISIYLSKSYPKLEIYLLDLFSSFITITISLTCAVSEILDHLHHHETMSATDAVTVAEKPVRRFPPPCWTQDEALALIQAYKERWYALRRGYLRTADWDAVAEEVGRVCPGAIPPKTSAQCRHKMEKLRQRYRAEKQRALSFPGGRFLSTWFYFEAMDAMENDGNGSNSDQQNGNDFVNSSDVTIVNLKTNQELNNSNVASTHVVGLNPGRGIRFKPAAADRNLVTIATRPKNSRFTNSYAEEEDEDGDNSEFGEGYLVETPIGENLGKTHKFPSKNYAARFQSEYPSNDGAHFGSGFRAKPSNFQDFEHSGVRPRKFSKTDANMNHNYWEENGPSDDIDGDDEVWMKMQKERKSMPMGVRGKYSESMDRNSNNALFDASNGSFGKNRGIKRDNDAIGQMVSSIKLLADGFVKMEKMKMDMAREIEKMRMEAEMKRNELILESQKQIVDAFVKGLVDRQKQPKQPKSEA